MRENLLCQAIQYDIEQGVEKMVFYGFGFFGFLKTKIPRKVEFFGFLWFLDFYFFV